MGGKHKVKVSTGVKITRDKKNWEILKQKASLKTDERTADTGEPTQRMTGGS